MIERASRSRAFLVPLVLLLVASAPFTIALLKLAPVLRIDVGPGDRDFVQGLSPRWRSEDDFAWRFLERRARAYFPATIEGPGRFTVEARHRGSAPARLRVQYDDGSTHEITVEPSPDWQRISVELPADRVRAHARLRFESSPEDGSLEVRAFEWSAEGVLPQRDLLLAGTVLLLGPFLASVLSGASPRIGAAASVLSGAALALWSGARPFPALQVLLALLPVVLAGIAVVGFLRLARFRFGAPLRILFFFALLLRAGALFHPEFYFYDLDVHETLLELIYHRGVADFWRRWPEYQVSYGIGVSVFEGVRRAFLYPVVFHLTAHIGNSIAHAPVFWLKLTAALFSALALFPLGYLARRLCPLPGAELLTGVLYFLVPAFSRGLLLLKFSAITGHFFDLCAVAFLAFVSLRVDSPARFAGAALTIAASLATYNSGFVHMGLLTGSALLLAPVLRGATRRQALGLAAAALLGLLLGVLSYHPDGIRNFLSAVIAGPRDPAGAIEGPGYSVTGMTLGSLGIPLLLLGGAGAVLLVPTLPAPLRLLSSAWLLSAAAANGLRYVFPELLTYQKELYWAGAALSVMGGGFLARSFRRGRPGAALVLLALALAAAVWLSSMGDVSFRFYGPYLFL